MFVEEDVVELKRQVRLLRAKHSALLKVLKRSGVLDEGTLREIQESVSQAIKPPPESH